MNERGPEQWLQCPKCGKFSGDDWSQCGKTCPVEMSPHFSQTAVSYYGSLIPYSREEAQRVIRERCRRAYQEDDEIPF